MSKVVAISLLFVVSQFGEIFTMFLLFSFAYTSFCTEGFFVLFKSSCNFIFASSGEISFQTITSSQLLGNI